MHSILLNLYNTGTQYHQNKNVPVIKYKNYTEITLKNLGWNPGWLFSVRQ